MVFLRNLWCILIATAIFILNANNVCAQLTASPTSIAVKVEPYYKYRSDGKPGRAITIILNGPKYKGLTTVKTDWNSIVEETAFDKPDSLNQLTVLLPEGVGVNSPTKVNLSVKCGTNKEIIATGISVQPKKQWTVYIYPHSHVDIGYTALQDTVKKLHVRNIDVGIDIADKTKNYPEGARFIWNPEATWVVDNYLKVANPLQKKSFIDAVKKGWIQIDGGHSNSNTSVLSDEEMIHFFKNAGQISALTGVPITTMVQMDVPGAGWGLVEAAAKNGIKGFLSFPNFYDLRQVWTNKPFYWRSADGKSRLFFLQAVSYGWGFKLKGMKYGLARSQRMTPEYDRLSTNEPLKNFIDPFIFEETAELEKKGSPYDIFAMTWSMADNCLIDADLPEAVKQWNEMYAYPKLIIAGSREIVDAYEKKYSQIIPEQTGDFTEFWTEGLGSDAKSVGAARRGKEDLVQAETLQAMLNKKQKGNTTIDFQPAWENLLLAAEHTWGYQDPRAPLAKIIEANKAAYFTAAEKESKGYVQNIVSGIEKKESSSVVVFNTLSWERDGLVTLSPGQSKAGDRVVDEKNQEMVAQRLTTGELVFMAKSIPSLGSRMFKVLPGKAGQLSGLKTDGTTLTNELLSLKMDGNTGNVISLFNRITGREYVDQSSPVKLNSFHYLPGVYNGQDAPGTVTNVKDAVIQVKENGPLIVSLIAKSTAEGCNWLTREVSLIKGQPYIEVVNTLDKIGTLKKEGIHFGYSFNIPSGDIRMDIPLGVMTPEKDQLPASNKNWYAFQRWIDISNKDYGVTWTGIEAPIVELGEITGTILDGARQSWLWIKKVKPTQTLYSWALNNHWNTNFPLQQSGVIRFKYNILLHGEYDQAAANRFGMEQHRPLIAVQANNNPLNEGMFNIANPKVILSAIETARDGEMLIRLRSVSAQAEKAELQWGKKKNRDVYECTPDGKPLKENNGTINLLPYGTVTLRVKQ